MPPRSKCLLAAIIAASLLIPPSIPRAEAKSSDYEGHWAETTIRWAMERNIVQGYSDGTYQPDRVVTEAEFLAMMIRFFPNSRERLARMTPKDGSDAEDWTAPYYMLSGNSEFNIPTNGMTERESRFIPISRGLVAQMITGTAGIKADLNESIRFMYEQRLSDGKTDKTLYGFEAGGSLTRAEAVQFLKKLEEQGLNKELKPRSVPASTNAETVNASPEDTVQVVKADPGKGFYWDYYLFIPGSVTTNKGPVHLLVEPNNSPGVSDDIAYHEQYAKKLIEGGAPHKIAKSLEVPLLVPVFPRPSSQSDIFTHALDRDTMQVTSGDLKRIDLQLLAMISDARDVLEARSIHTEDKIFMNGFSSSSKFVNRFVLLHPEKVKATTTGGVGGLPAIPADRWNGLLLQYPLGTADLRMLTGHAFDQKAYNQIAQFIYMGELDKNDAYQFRDGFDPGDTALVNEYIGRTMMPDRWNKAQAIFRELGAPAQFKTYANVGHGYNNAIINDIIKFYRDHRD